MDQRVTDMRVVLCAALQSLDGVATTTDCRSYLGVTAHWIDPSRARIGCARLSPAASLSHILSARQRLGRRAPAVRHYTTTDNGCNFVKAFGRGNDGSDSDGEAGRATPPRCMTTRTSYLTRTTVSSSTRHSSGGVHATPCRRWQRQYQHWQVPRSLDKGFSLRVTRSLDKGSALLAEAVVELRGLNLLRPCRTRWNSVFFAFERLGRIIREKGEYALRSLCNQLSVPEVIQVFTWYCVYARSVSFIPVISDHLPSTAAITIDV